MDEPREEIKAGDMIGGKGSVSVSEPEPPGRESMRGALAAVLLAVLVLEVTLVTLSIVFHWLTFEEAKNLFLLVTTPTISLFGPVIGFYYSSRR